MARCTMAKSMPAAGPCRTPATLSACVAMTLQSVTTSAFARFAKPRDPHTTTHTAIAFFIAILHALGRFRPGGAATFVYVITPPDIDSNIARHDACPARTTPWPRPPTAAAENLTIWEAFKWG